MAARWQQLYGCDWQQVRMCDYSLAVSGGRYDWLVAGMAVAGGRYDWLVAIMTGWR